VQTATATAVTARAEVVEANGAGRRCAEAHARLVVMTVAEAADAFGDLDQQHARYLRR